MEEICGLVPCMLTEDRELSSAAAMPAGGILLYLTYSAQDERLLFREKNETITTIGPKTFFSWGKHFPCFLQYHSSMTQPHKV